MGPPRETDRDLLRKLIREAICGPACGGHEAAIERIIAALEPIISDLDECVYSGWEASMGEDL